MNIEHYKIALVAPFLTHYRINFYNELNEHVGGNMLFFFQNKLSDDGRPGIIVENSNSFQLYSNISFSAGRLKLTFSPELIKQIRKQRIKVLIIEGASSNLTSWFFIVFRKLLGVKVVAWACGWQPEIASRFTRKLKKKVERVFFNSVDQVITYSSKAVGYFKDLGVNVPMNIAYNGIDTDLYHHSKDEILEAARLLKPSGGQKIFLYVGGLFQEKNVDLLIESFKVVHNENPAIILWIIGSGPMLNDLKNRVQHEGINDIVFWGRIEKGVDVYFAAVDFLVLPGVGGLALNQAMLWGTPCIVSEADGTEDDLVFDTITGFRFAKNNKVSLIEAMKKAIRLTESEYKLMGNKAQELILSRSNTNQMVNTFSEVLHEII